MTNLHDRVSGFLLAGAVGDALGAPIEFDRIDAIRAAHGPAGLTDLVPAFGRAGAITDDTQMTLFTLEGLVLARRHGVDPLLAVRAAYGRWLQTQGGPEVTPDGWLIHERELHSLRAPGNTCLTALRRPTFGTVTNRLNTSKGCGGVMRAAPAALWSTDVREVFALGAGVAALTHGHPSGYLSAGVLAVLVRRLLDGDDLPNATAVARAELVRWEGHQEQLVLLDRAVEMTRDGRPTPEVIADRLGGGWVGEEALAISLHAALVADDVADGLVLAVNHSGDSDSTGAICGNLLGARDGAGTVPQHWLDRLELRDAVERLAREALDVLAPAAF
ncbi:ADP-ribosylglycohydrolase family protein [Umezawaea beigongshangensis]|uniref:ADP-ribosylglycohydrolase family protein n=1 Tax=Umezawaea beigongshangensis TaxID=2780383 RepID=UPI0018F25600|nr:ADP-ribosylglycohydrolase family protein [Umezawaea beigongshangensis]